MVLEICSTYVSCLPLGCICVIKKKKKMELSQVEQNLRLHTCNLNIVNHIHETLSLSCSVF